MTDKSLRARPGQAGVLLERMAVRHILSQRRTGRHTCSRAISLCHHFHWVSLPRTNKPLLHTQIYVYGHLSACSHRFSGAVFLFPSRFKFLWWKQNLMCIYCNYCSFFFFTRLGQLFCLPYDKNVHRHGQSSIYVAQDVYDVKLMVLSALRRESVGPHSLLFDPPSPAVMKNATRRPERRDAVTNRQI